MTTNENPSATLETTLLKERLHKLESKDLDWAAWKKGTLLVLEKIFGKESPYVNELSQTDYEFSSWSLRDTSGGGDPVKASCKELLDICLTDISSRGLESTKAPSAILNNIKNTLLQFIDQKTVTAIQAIADSESPEMDKEEQIIALLKQKRPKHQEAMLGRLLLLMLRS